MHKFEIRIVLLSSTGENWQTDEEKDAGGKDRLSCSARRGVTSEDINLPVMKEGDWLLFEYVCPEEHTMLAPYSMIAEYLWAHYHPKNNGGRQKKTTESVHRWFMQICDGQSPCTLELNANLSIQFAARNYFYELEIVYVVASNDVDIYYHCILPRRASVSAIRCYFSLYYYTGLKCKFSFLCFTR